MRACCPLILILILAIDCSQRMLAHYEHYFRAFLHRFLGRRGLALANRWSNSAGSSPAGEPGLSFFPFFLFFTYFPCLPILASLVSLAAEPEGATAVVCPCADPANLTTPRHRLFPLSFSSPFSFSTPSFVIILDENAPAIFSTRFLASYSTRCPLLCRRRLSSPPLV